MAFNWNTGFASAENKRLPVTAMPANAANAKLRAHASKGAGAVADKPQSKRTSITAMAPANKTRKTMCPTLAAG